ncbi:MAG TPA: ComF family protein [Burkholderiaceae bacterium]|nr:ComF family protein [Burkholderiaceae bacterium]
MLPDLRRCSRRWWQRRSALLPSTCALCGSSGQLLCPACHAQFFGSPPPRCRRCAIALPPADAATVCGTCLKAAPAFDATLVAADYAAPLDQLVQGLKFGHQLALAPLFASLLRDVLLKASADAPLPALLTAVPLGPQRLAQRGFNQALEIARPLSSMLGIALEPQLVWRQRETRPQTLLLPQQRQQNIRGAFMLDSTALARIAGRHIGVVDDVITTGGTLGELAATLKRYGAARVTNFVFARTPPH